MWWIPWVASTSLVGVAVLFNYAIVLFNAFGDFPLPSNVPQSVSYFESPYWLNLPRSSVTVIVAFQALAAVGYIMWYVSIVMERPTTGLLADMRWLVASTLLFLVPSAVWPFSAFYLLRNTSSVTNAVASSACLWLAATGIMLMVGGTFEDKRESPIALLGILLTSLVVVIADGVGWSALAIYGTVHDTLYPHH